jgi:hypothetical protein
MSRKPITSMELSDNSAEVQFRSQLTEIYNGDKKTILIKKDDYFKLIDELKVASAAEHKTGWQYYILKK